MEHVALAGFVMAVVVLLARDAASRRRIGELERRTAAAEAEAGARRQMATVGELVSGLAQELKTPLQGVLGNTELMLAADGRSDELRDIRDHAVRAADIVHNLIAFTETTALARRWQDLNEVTRRAVDAARAAVAAAGHRVQFAAADRLPVVYVDGRQLENAIAVLLGHAAAARPRSTPAGPVQPIAVSTRQPADDRLVIDIEFPGVTQDAVERALAAGDLDACRHVIRAHGGRLTVGSRSSGAGVAIELPAAVVDLTPSLSPTAATS